MGALVGFAVISGWAVLFLPWLLSYTSEGTVGAFVIGAVFVLLFGVTLGASRARITSVRTTVYRSALLIWWFLLVWEIAFERLNDPYSMTQGTFAAQAYEESAMWVLAFCALLVISLRQPGYLRQLFSGSHKWLSVFILFSLVSIAYAPGKAYSAAWGFKLLLIVLVLQLCATLSQNLSDVVTFLKVTMWAFLVLSVVPVMEAFSSAGPTFEDGRLAGDPDWLSPVAAVVMLTALILYSVEKKKHYVPVGLVGLVVMFLAFGKSGIVAGIFAALLFLLLQGQVVRSLGLLLGVGAVGGLIISVTPIAGYLHSYAGADSLTGRTVIWSGAMEAIRQSPIWGHGFLSTYFAFSRGTAQIEFMHLHNAFLEVAYNNGLIGVVLLLIVNYVIVRNVVTTMRMATILQSRGDERGRLAYILAVGFLAMYVDSFVDGLFNASFGGRPRNFYMFFLAVFMLSAVTQRLVSQMLGNTNLNQDQPRQRLYSVVTYQPK
ncbi:MAG: O-antigen ligase family protein [Terriglobales bacterium]